MNKLGVCVTGTGGGGFGEQIAKALKHARTPYRLVCTDISLVSSGTDFADEFCQLPPAREPNYIQELLTLCRVKQIKALFPGSEPELLAISQHREQFMGAGIFLPINPDGVIRLCMDKVRLSKRLGELGFSIPQFRQVRTLQDIEGFECYPIVLKPSVGSGGSSDVFIAQTADECNWYARYLLGLYPEFIAQEYVGTPNDEYTVGVLTDMDGLFINSIVLKRRISSALSCRLKIPNRTGRAELGQSLVVSSGISQGEIGHYPAIAGPCETIAQSIGARGSINIQCRYANGKIHLFEINPRFSGTTSLRALAGYNEPDVLIRKHLLGEEVAQRFAYRQGVVLRRLQEVFFPAEDGAA